MRLKRILKKIIRIIFICLISNFIYVFLTENVFAENITLKIATIEGNNVGDNQNGSYTNYTYSNGDFFDTNIGVLTVSEDGQYDYSFKRYPYVVVYFKTALTDFTISRTTTCNSSCYSSSYILKNLGKTDYAGYDYFQYVLILPVNKYQTSCPITGSCMYQVQDIIRFTQKQTGSTAWLFTNIILTDDITSFTNESTDLAIQDLKNILNNAINNTGNATITAIDAMREAMINDSVDNSFQGQTLNGISDQMASNSVISDLLLLPVRLFENIISATNGSCQRFSLGTLYGTELILPCIDIQSLLGASLYSVIDVIISGYFVYSIRKKFIEIFNNMTNLKDRGNELE